MYNVFILSHSNKTKIILAYLTGSPYLSHFVGPKIQGKKGGGGGEDSQFQPGLSYAKVLLPLSWSPSASPLSSSSSLRHPYFSIFPSYTSSSSSSSSSDERPWRPSICSKLSWPQDNFPPRLGASHHRVVQLMQSAAANGCVNLGIRRLVSTPASGPDGMASANASSDPTGASLLASTTASTGAGNPYPYDVTVERRENEGFGFVIVSSVAKKGLTIGRIIEASPAERCNILHVGDRFASLTPFLALSTLPTFVESNFEPRLWNWTQKTNSVTDDIRLFHPQNRGSERPSHRQHAPWRDNQANQGLWIRRHFNYRSSSGSGRGRQSGACWTITASAAASAGWEPLGFDPAADAVSGPSATANAPNSVAIKWQRRSVFVSATVRTHHEVDRGESGSDCLQRISDHRSTS